MLVTHYWSQQFLLFTIQHQGCLGISHVFGQFLEHPTLLHFALGQVSNGMHHRKEHHAIGTAERIKAPVIADRIYIRIPDAAFFVQLPLGWFQRCFARFYMTTLGFPCVPLLMLWQDSLSLVVCADHRVFVRRQNHRVSAFWQFHCRETTGSRYG